MKASMTYLREGEVLHIAYKERLGLLKQALGPQAIKESLYIKGTENPA
jgi:hypothetical protein